MKNEITNVVLKEILELNLEEYKIKRLKYQESQGYYGVVITLEDNITLDSETLVGYHKLSEDNKLMFMIEHKDGKLELIFKDV